MTWQIPWVIAGVDEVPLSIARTMAFVTTAGREGVVANNHLKVTANGTSVVSIAPGVFVAQNRFRGAAFESYVGRNWSTSVTVSIPNTGGTSRTDLVYAHITDPGQAGHQPSEPTQAAPIETRVITNVNPNIKRVQEHPGYEEQSGYALARITRAANATTVSTAQLTDLRYLLEASTSPIGQMTMYAGNPSPGAIVNATAAAAAPADVWVLCNGQAVSRTLYAALFSVIGTAFGSGDGTNTFNVPDMRGRTAIGAGTGDAFGATAHTLGQKTGKQTHTLLINEMPTHDHDVHVGWAEVEGLNNWQIADGSGIGFRRTHIATTDTTGSNFPHSLMQPSTVVNYIIKAN